VADRGEGLAIPGKAQSDDVAQLPAENDPRGAGPCVPGADAIEPPGENGPAIRGEGHATDPETRLEGMDSSAGGDVPDLDGLPASRGQEFAAGANGGGPNAVGVSEAVGAHPRDKDGLAVLLGRGARFRLRTRIPCDGNLLGVPIDLSCPGWGRVPQPDG